MPRHPARRSSLLVGVALAAGCQAAPSFAPPPEASFPRVAGELLVKARPGSDVAALRARHGIATGEAVLPGVERWVLPAGDGPEAWAARLGQDPDCAFAQPNYVRRTQAFSNSNLDLTLQWYLGTSTVHGIDVQAAWNRCVASPPGAGVLVAVVDTGVDIDHPDLAGAIATDSSGVKRFINELDSGRVDDNGHGTHVAGTLAGRGSKKNGVVGVAPGALILPVKTMDGTGNGNDFAIAKGFKDAVDAGADVVNFSVGGEAPSPILAEAMAYGFARGTLFVIAAGNYGTPVLYPAAYAGVVAVGATTASGAHASYSNYGPQLTVVAPGGDAYAAQPARGIYSTLPTYATYMSRVLGKGPNYGVESGTSMATPVVGGLAALIMAEAKARGHRLTPAQVHTRISATAEDVGAVGFDPLNGYGMIRPEAALLATGDAP